MSETPTEDDVKNAKKTSDLLSGVIQIGFNTNHEIPPMPPYPAIPLKNLESLTEKSESLCQQVIVYCKQLKRHAESKGLEVGPLVTGLASIDIREVAVTYGAKT